MVRDDAEERLQVDLCFLKAVRSTVSSLIEKIGQDNERVSNIMRTCNPKRNATHSLDNISQFHACFMPEACGTYLSRVLTCVNKNNQEMTGCEKEIEEMVKCGIDKFHQPLAKTINLKNDEELVIEGTTHYHIWKFRYINDRFSDVRCNEQEGRRTGQHTEAI